MSKQFGQRLLDSRWLLLIGFGALLLWPLIAFLSARSQLTAANNQSRTVRARYLRRNQLLNELRGDVVNGGSDLRNYLLEPDDNAALLHRTKALATRTHALSLLAATELKENATLYRKFVEGYESYWHTMEPVLHWNAAHRKMDGFRFIRDEGSAKRGEILALAAQIGAWNEEQLASSADEIQHLFEGVRSDLELRIGLFLIAGIALACLVYWRIVSLERQASERFGQVEQARAESRELSGRLLNVQEEERRRIARELHDEVAQNLSAVRVGLERTLRVLPPGSRELASEEVRELERLTERTLKFTREMSQSLRPSMLDDLGLAPALRWLAKEWQRRSTARVEVETEEDLEDLGEETRICVFRVVQEALNNALNHGAASEVRIRANRDAGKLLVSIQDNGKSFDVDREKGMGILGMSERVENLGGRFSIVSSEGVGTVVMAELP
ncbi:sensor histidine kinase [Bryobacter aggregatus]|uniref:sensor histidine kinase n=1 Tax=Bryobacter aggregatus TaxID=360054 RepID=UPI00138E0CFF|nr:sensor histidine kinase [Bryobacter aggregatus]